MSEEEREKIKEKIKELIRLLYRDDLSQFGKRNLETYINKLMEETGKVKQLEKENEALKEENAILEGNKIGLKLAIQELKEDNSHQWEERCRLTFELEELKEELDYYKQKENQEFDERDYYEE